ncbi:hypothetical protein OF829_17715 [Sphingomonas sp. LB-2]|uniref:hypothetical protein n=1 Tax=Sphingomonas caeni TaxID=2984949 RepID=UPI0022319929|nr:hypothetical protein [Sphingomonas caeni]MCW3849080.1 hypothetical protein [Sphingomonas caeni]
MRIALTRDSVCAGDDVFAQHEQTVTVDDALPLGEAIGRIASDYLARISCGEASWVAILDDEPVAVVAQQWKAPRLHPGYETRTLRDGARLHFAYHVQEDPEKTFATRRGTRSFQG